MNNGMSLKNLLNNLTKAQKIGIVAFFGIIIILVIMIAMNANHNNDTANEQIEDSNTEYVADNDNSSSSGTEQSTPTGKVYTEYIGDPADPTSFVYSVAVDDAQNLLTITTDTCGAEVLKHDAFNYAIEQGINPYKYTVVYETKDTGFDCPEF